MERNYEDTRFSMENYQKLLDQIKSKRQEEGEEANDLAMEMLQDAVKAYTNYVDVVDNTENRIRIAYVRLEGDDLTAAIMNADQARRIAHNAAISMVAAMGRLCDIYGVPHFFLGTVDEEDNKFRLAVADFCLDITSALFRNRRN